MSQVRAEEVLDLVAPKFAEALRVTLEHPDHVGKSPDWRKTMLGAVSRVVAALVQTGRDPGALTPFALVEETAGETLDPRATTLAHRELEQRRGTAVTQTTVQVSLLRHCIDHSARLSLRRSPLALYSSGMVVGAPPANALPFYTATICNDPTSLTTLLRTVYGAWEGR